MIINPNGHDDDRQFELHKEAILAEDSDKSISWMDMVSTQGIVDIRLNGQELATIDPNARMITGLPGCLSFAQFEFINKIYQAITKTH